ncbi:hypothetical protein EUGRSUZ_F00049 [Eucalyptus grandis]|uniref:Uncharacterized protein n=2 Tax=Eucalyptus grandis TaxID=71139 RepID=A0ACC3KB44_EUCGR|nr:hypothetical protein EUGRSUZ_F00049 [Eucalyptus grandis]
METNLAPCFVDGVTLTTVRKMTRCSLNLRSWASEAKSAGITAGVIRLRRLSSGHFIPERLVLEASTWFQAVTVSQGSSVLICHKCGEQFKKLDAVEAHHLSKHAVTELSDGDSSKRIVEIICQTSWLKSEHSSCEQIERVLKVHNMQRTLARFKEY